MNDTIVALATPYGESAIAVVRVSGELSYNLLCDAFKRKQILPNKIYHGTYFSLKSENLDDSVFVFFKKPSSYTGENAAEVYLHGNMLIVSRILDDLCARGCRIADRGEFTRRAFLNKKLDLCQAEAVMDVICSSSETALAISQAQLAGKLSEQLHYIDDELISILASFETHIDFIEDDVDHTIFTKSTVLHLQEIVDKIDNLLLTSRYRAILYGGLNVAIIGAPNSGKSSLLNFLLGTERAIVSPEAGTTRDFISERIMLGRYHINLLDTAGLRKDVSSDIESKGVSKSIEQIKHVNAYLLVLDSSDKIPILPEEVCAVLNEENCLVIENKIDLPNSKDCKEFFSTYKHIKCSIKYDNANLKPAIEKFLLRHYFLPNEIDVVVNARHVDILERTKTNILSAQNVLFSNGVEFAANDIRNALEILGEITGYYNNEDMLDKLFGAFCVGK